MKEKKFKIKCIPDVSFKHYGGGTSSKKHYIRNYYRVRNMIWFMKRYNADKSLFWKVKVFFRGFKPHFFRMFSCHFLIVSYANIKGIIHGVCKKWEI